MSKLPLLALTLVISTACTSKPSPEAAPAAAAEATPEAPAPEPAQTKVDEQPTADASEAEPTPPPAEPTPEPPAPEPIPTPLDPTADAVLVALGAGNHEGIEILATYEHGRSRILLYRLDVAARFRAAQPEDSEQMIKLDERFDACEAEDDEPWQLSQCNTEAATELGIPAEIIPHLVGDSRSYAWEVAHVELDRAGKARVLARKRLLDFGLDGDLEDVETKLKVYDMDGDKRSEILVVFGFNPPADSYLETTEAAVGFVLDKVDFHIQYATTRMYREDFSDVSTSSTEIETTWLAKDENGDGFPDLAVRERTRESWSTEDEDDYRPPTDTKKTRSMVCLYELAGDRWVCPESMGTGIVDGNKLVEVTSVPVALEPATPAAEEPAPEPAPEPAKQPAK